jgi:glutamyl-Q tRNA(Asp) synthetase
MAIAQLTRYAPSPTGYMHLGHVAHMLYVWGTARACGAEVLLRVEDHDRGRCRPEFEVALFEDIAWLGFDAVNTVDAVSPFRQSDCEARYEDALQRLKAIANVYRCGCTRREIAARISPNHDGERPYDGLCRAAKSRPGGASIRLELEPGGETFIDGLLGEQVQDPAQQCGDLLLRQRTQQSTYQFAVTVDDLAHGVDLIVRGEDLLASTGRQIRLARLLGRQQLPLFLHHPLIRDSAGSKLSKKTASAPIREMRRTGQSVHDVLGTAAYAVGLEHEDTPQELDALLDRVASRIRAITAW